jgi:hypothetical protein
MNKKTVMLIVIIAIAAGALIIWRLTMPKSKPEIIRRKTGIVLPEDIIIEEYENYDYTGGGFRQAKLRSSESELSDLLEQMIESNYWREGRVDDDHILLKKVWGELVSNIDYRLFERNIGTKRHKGLNTTDVLIIANENTNDYSVYIHYIGD